MKKLIFILLISVFPAFVFAQYIQRGGGTAGVTMVYPTAGIGLSTGTGWTTSITDNSAHWNTAYGWGNWASSRQTSTSTSTTLFPSWSGAKAYADSVAALLQRITNLVNATSTSTTKYMSANAVKSYCDSVAALLGRIASPTFTGYVSSPVFTATTTDTSTGSYPVGSVFMRIASGDTSMWVLVRRTGTIAARWKKLTN